MPCSFVQSEDREDRRSNDDILVATAYIFYIIFINNYYKCKVEHPCTEMVANVNLPAAQLMIAMGIPLHRIKSIRSLWGQNEASDSLIDFHTLPRPIPSGMPECKMELVLIL